MTSQNTSPVPGSLPLLEWEEWKDTAETLQLYMQIVGKTRLALTPKQNHWWNVPLYLSARGLHTSVMPLAQGEVLDIEFDLIAHQLVFRSSDGTVTQMPLVAKPVAAFYREYLAVLQSFVAIELDPMPVEISHPIRFDLDNEHKTYDPEKVACFWRCLRFADRLFKRFSTTFYGKISPVHFFWGSFDLAVTRFSGKRAPAKPGVDRVQAEAYSHEVISAGFWPGNGGYARAAFYAYAAPVPAQLHEAVITPPGRFAEQMGEFVLDYEDVRTAADPAKTVLRFLEETYSAAADAAVWDRAVLDRTDVSLLG